MTDQFYTKPDLAKNMYAILNNKIDLNSFDILLEPSAGTGSFFKLMDRTKRVGIDLDPKYKGVQKCDFFDYKFLSNKKYAVIGNPPYSTDPSKQNTTPLYNIFTEEYIDKCKYLLYLIFS